MQGFIETAFGLKPLNLTNIQNVTYVTNRDIPYFSDNMPSGSDGVLISTGSLIIEYIGNATGYRNSGGNIVIGLDHYQDEYYPVERFWAWVKDVSAGSVTKTFNQYLNNKPAYGVSTFAVTDFAPVTAYGIRLTDEQTVEDACDLTFKYDDSLGKGMFNYVTFVTDGQTTFPEIGTRVFLSTTQGYNPNAVDNAPVDSIEAPPAFEKVVDQLEQAEVNVNAANAMATSPVVADGRYAWLDGTPENQVDQFPPGGGAPQIVTNAQSGSIYEVVIKSGRIHEVIACPADFTAFNAVSDIPGKMYSRIYDKQFITNYGPDVEKALGFFEQVQGMNCPCWIFSEPQVNKVVGEDNAPSVGGGGEMAFNAFSIVCTAGQYGGFGLSTIPNPWYDVTLGFTDIPPASLTLNLETGATLVCPTSGQGLDLEQAKEILAEEALG